MLLEQVVMGLRLIHPAANRRRQPACLFPPSLVHSCWISCRHRGICTHCQQLAILQAWSLHQAVLAGGQHARPVLPGHCPHLCLQVDEKGKAVGEEEVPTALVHRGDLLKVSCCLAPGVPAVATAGCVRASLRTTNPGLCRAPGLSSGSSISL